MLRTSCLGANPQTPEDSAAGAVYLCWGSIEQPTGIALMEIKQISQVVGPSSAAVEGKRSIEQVVGFGFGHRFRVEIRRALHDRPATAAELANILHQPRERLRYHIEELLKDGSIE